MYFYCYISFTICGIMWLTDYIDDIAVGIVASIIASIIILCVQKTFTNRNLRNEIGFNLEFATDSIYAACQTYDFSTAATHVSRAMDYLQRAWVAILAKGGKNKKFFFTITHSIYHGCSVCLNNLVINEGKSIKSYTREYLGDDEETFPTHYLLLSMLIHLNYGESLIEACRGTIVRSDATLETIERMLNSALCVDVNSFKPNYYKNWFFDESCG